MAIGVDPELSLSIGSAANSNPDDRCSYAAGLDRVQSLLRSQNKQQMTIFYNGRVCVCDATEMKARIILSVAKKETDEMMKKKEEEEQSSGSALHQPPAPALSPQTIPQLLNPGLSMKRSLQRFLQKREARISEVSPYNQRHRLLFP